MVVRWILDEGKFLLKTIIIITLSLIVTVILSGVLSNVLLEKELLLEEIEKLPPLATLELIGMQSLQVFPAQVEVFFLILMVLNLVIIGLVIGHSVDRMRASFENGTFVFYYMQVMNKGIYYVFAVFRLLFVNITVWAIYILGTKIGISYIVKGLDGDVVAVVEGIHRELAVRGIGVLILMTAIGVLYGIKQNQSLYGIDFGLCVMGVLFVLGNIYKIPQFIGQKQVEAMVNAQEIMKLTYQMKQMRSICPFSILNPFSIYHNIFDADMAWRYAGIGIMVLLVAGIVFWVRNWREL